MKAFRESDALVLDVYRETKGFPSEERFGLQAQIRRAAVSVPTNIVEGSARTSESEYCRFLEVALGSARETSYLLSLATRLGFLDATLVRALEDRYGAVQGKLHNLIAAIRPDR